MSGLYNLLGQFGGMYNNAQMNQYNQNYQDWLYGKNYAQQQYQDDLDYWNQMNDFDQQMQGYNMWSSGASRGAPIQPRERPDMPFIGGPPVKPDQVDFGALMGGMGGFGGGFNPSGAPQIGGFNYSGFDVPEWNNPGIDTANMVDPTAVIQSAQPGIMEAMHDAFADAGNRFGSSGMVGTPYADALGDASRSAAQDIAHITNQYTYQSALDAAQREQERAMAEYAADVNAWNQQGDWGFGSWQNIGDWQMQDLLNQSNLANQQWMAQNDWRFQDYMGQQQFDQNMLSQLLPMLFGGMMGGF